MKYVLAVALFVIFCLAGVVAWAFALAGLAFGRDGIHYSANVVHSLDQLLGAVLGYDGRKTVSKECATRDSLFCRLLCRFLSKYLEPDHCSKQVR